MSTILHVDPLFVRPFNRCASRCAYSLSWFIQVSNHQGADWLTEFNAPLDLTPWLPEIARTSNQESLSQLNAYIDRLEESSNDELLTHDRGTGEVQWSVMCLHQCFTQVCFSILSLHTTNDSPVLQSTYHTVRSQCPKSSATSRACTAFSAIGSVVSRETRHQEKVGEQSLGYLNLVCV